MVNDDSKLSVVKGTVTAQLTVQTWLKWQLRSSVSDLLVRLYIKMHYRGISETGSIEIN